MKDKPQTIMPKFIHSFHWCVNNAAIPCRSQELPLCYILSPATLHHQLFLHPLSPHLAIYFLVYLSILLFPNSYTIPSWEFYFLPFSVHAQTNIIYLTLLSKYKPKMPANIYCLACFYKTHSVFLKHRIRSPAHNCHKCERYVVKNMPLVK